MRNEKLGRIAMARVINQACAGEVVTPWNVYQLPDDWLDAFLAFVDEHNRHQKREAAKAAADAEMRRKIYGR